MTPWARQLLRRGEVFVGEGDTALAGVFDDHARIASLSLHAVVNVPLLAVLAAPWVLQSAAGILPTSAALSPA